MRDILLLSMIGAAALIALRHAWVGVMLWTWISIMNPHRYTFGFAHDAPLAAVAAAATLIGFATARDRDNPFKDPCIGVFMAFFVWMTLSWLAGIDPEGDYSQWSKVTKVFFMIFVALSVLRSKQHIFALIWVCVMSLLILGAKGGVFTILSGGSYRVYGPPGSFIEDNNEFAVALIMTIPLLRFLQMQLQSKWGRRLMTLSMVLLAVSAIGSHSRGALLATTATVGLLWWRSPGRARNLVLIVPVAIALVAFMPEDWTKRMETIETYDQDASAMGRISAWWNAWNLAKARLMGAGFNAARPELFALYSPYPDMVQGAHSIYFLVLGNHGWPGLILWLAMWVLTWRSAAWLRAHGREHPESVWAEQFGSMAQASMLAYFVGGAFLSLSYFDLPYNLMAAIVLTRVWVQKKLWLTEKLPQRWRMPGLLGPAPRAAPA